MKQQISQKLVDAANGIVRTTAPITRDAPKIGRNEPCWCGSDLKYKKCCLLTEREYQAAVQAEAETRDSQPRQRELEDLDVDELLEIIENKGDEQNA